jgi:hypothetical protein
MLIEEIIKKEQEIFYFIYSIFIIFVLCVANKLKTEKKNSSWKINEKKEESLFLSLFNNIFF